MEFIEFINESKYIKDFLSLPKKLYTKDNNTENSSFMKELLLGKNPLNNYFKLYKYLVYKDKKVVGRFCFTKYDNDNTLYLGFFECINDKEVAKFLFDKANEEAKKMNIKKIVGPVDGSFWNKYRLKINLFNKRPYTGEPYNKEYYFDLFKDNNYKVIEHYTSQIYGVVDENYENKKFEEHYKEFLDKGYVIKSPTIQEYEKCIEEIYYLLMDLYSDFPIFKYIELKDFQKIFSNYKKIINVNMIKMGYFNNKAVGFFISVPNYNNIVYHTNSINNIIDILKLKNNPKEYVLLYMGVDKKHRGLGKALAESIVEELRISKLPSIGALTRDGKITQNYADNLINQRYEYVLLERKI